jgi:hypothetical protein
MNVTKNLFNIVILDVTYDLLLVPHIGHNINLANVLVPL